MDSVFSDVLKVLDKSDPVSPSLSHDEQVMELAHRICPDRDPKALQEALSQIKEQTTETLPSSQVSYDFGWTRPTHSEKALFSKGWRAVGVYGWAFRWKKVKDGAQFNFLSVSGLSYAVSIWIAIASGVSAGLAAFSSGILAVLLGNIVHWGSKKVATRFYQTRSLAHPPLDNLKRYLAKPKTRAYLRAVRQSDYPHLVRGDWFRLEDLWDEIREEEERRERLKAHEARQAEMNALLSGLDREVG